MEASDLAELLHDRYKQFSFETVKSVLAENDYRLGPSEQALEAMSARQGSQGASSSQVRPWPLPDPVESSPGCVSKGSATPTVATGHIHIRA